MAMKTSVERFINNQNIKNFRKRLEAPIDETQRATLQRLLAEEEAKAEQFAQQADANNKETRSL
jgi:hypothetical protein